MESGTTRLAAAAFGVLLLATVGAFFLANRLKAQPPEINVLRRDTYFSPNGDGRRDTDTWVFSGKLNATAEVQVVDADGVLVRRLATHKRLRKRARQHVTWDGRTDAGKRAPDGEYRLRFILDGGRALLAPRPVFVDTVPPRPAVVVDAATPIVRPGTAVPFRVRGAGADTPPTFTVVRTDVSPARPVRTLAGATGRTAYSWDGNTEAGTPAPPGTYLIAVTAYDKARNAGEGPHLPLSNPPTAVDGRPGVTIRALAAQPPVRAIRAGDPFDVRVDARGRAFSWTLRRLGVTRPVAHGLEKGGRTDLLLHAPRGPSGVFLLHLQSHGANTTVPVAVHARSHVGPLIVLPMVTWLGRDPIDTTGDGVPDVFGSGSAVRFPRPFAYPGGMPATFWSDISPLLVSLDKRHLRYDLATDLDLDFEGPPKARGIVMAGAPTWVSRELAGRLRSFVNAGGRLALFGPDALRASVSVGDAVLARPSSVTPLDALGARLAAVHPVTGTLGVLAEDTSLGLLTGFSGDLGGFDSVEELIGPGRGGKVLTSVGATTAKLRPALSATSYGKGLVIRVGLPGWATRLKDPAVAQITANIIDVLRHVKPKAFTAAG